MSNEAKTNYERYQYSLQRGHKDYIKKHDACDAFFFDEQWEKEDRDKLVNSKRPALTINKIKPIILDMTGEFLSNRSEVKFVPTSTGQTETATALTKLFLHIQNEQELDEKELILWFDGIITSRAYYDVRVEFDDNDRGEVRVFVPNPKNVIPDPDSDSKDPDDWNEVIIKSYLTIQDVEFLYGKSKATKIKQYPELQVDIEGSELHNDTFAGPDFTTHHVSHGSGDETTQRLYLVIERQYKAMEDVQFFINEQTGDLRRVPPSWTSSQTAQFLEQFPEFVIEKRRKQIVRWVVSCGDVLLHNDVSPYDKFTIIPWFPIFRRGKSSGAVESLLDPQRNFNKLRSQELHIVNGTSNSGWKVKRGSLTNMTTEDLEIHGAKTGLVVEYDGESEKVIDRIQPVSIPQGVDRISEKADRDLKTVSGVDDEARGVARSQTAGKAIQARREAALISLAPYFDSLAWTRKRLAKRILALIQKFYTEERHIRITSSDARNQITDIGLNVPQEDGTVLNDLTLGEYDVVVTPTPQRDSEEQETFNELLELSKLGWSIPVHLMVETMHLARKPEIVESIKAANGMVEPSEEERQLQQMMQELEMEEKRAAIAARMAQAQLSQARAQKVLSEIDAAKDDTEKLEELLLRARDLDAKIHHNERSMDVRERALDVQAAKAGLDDIVKNRQIDAQLEQRQRDAQQPTGASNG